MKHTIRVLPISKSWLRATRLTYLQNNDFDVFLQVKKINTATN